MIKKSEFENIESLSNITRKMIWETSEITNVSSLEVASSSWERTTLLNDQAMKWAKAQVFVYPDSVSCLGGLNSPDDAIRRWEEEVSSWKMYSSFRQVQGLDGEPIDFEWKNFTGFSASQLLRTIQKDWEGKHIIPENFSDRIIFMSMFNDIELEKRRNKDSCTTSRATRDYFSKFKDGHWAFLGPREENKWYHDYAASYEGKWDLCASKMVNDFEDSGHPAFNRVSPLDRGKIEEEK